jgi:hypothetical protein
MIEILKEELNKKKLELENLNYYVIWLEGVIKVEEIKGLIKKNNQSSKEEKTNIDYGREDMDEMKKLIAKDYSFSVPSEQKESK